MPGSLRPSIGLAALALFLAVAPAEAVTFRGETSQGRRMTVRLNDSTGTVERVVFGWRLGCNPGRYSSSTEIVGPLLRDRPPHFFDAGSYAETPARGYSASVRIHLRGFRDVDDPGGEHIRGSFRVRATVRRRGEVVDSCGVRSAIRFRLTPVR